jgi:hypothetical protein
MMVNRNPSRCLRWLAAIALVATAAPVLAHPLGNDNIEHVSVLWIFPDRLEVDFLLFLAENPSTRMERDEMDTDKTRSLRTRNSRSGSPLRPTGSRPN